MRTHAALLLVVGLLLTACDDPTGPGTGSIRVAASTGGIDLDPDGYTVSVDESPSQAVGINASAAFADVTVGDHAVELTGVAANCAITGANPRTLAVSAGSTATTTFQVTCAGGSVIEVTVTTTGIHPDADGYIVTADGGDSRPIGANGTEVFTGLASGHHEIWLSGVAIDCALEGVNPRVLAVNVGSTVSTTFNLHCGAAYEGEIAFVSSGDIYVIDAHGSNPVNLTKTGGGDFDPAWSPDGTRIAFASHRDQEPGRVDIFVMNADGSNPVNLTFMEEGSSFHRRKPAWSPDGTRIAFIYRGGIYVMNADGANVINLGNVILSNISEYIFAPIFRSLDWSPDGTKIAFSLSDDICCADIYAVNADGSNPRNLTRSRVVDDDSPAWSPDGRRIAHSRRAPGGTADIYVMGADGSNVANLSNNPARDHRPAWSPDGTRIAFESDRHDIYFDIYVMDADGANLIRLTDHAGSDGSPAWAPWTFLKSVGWTGVRRAEAREGSWGDHSRRGWR